MEHILSLSYGKDSLACLGAIEELGWPLDRIVHAEVWATDTIPADLPPMVEFKANVDKTIKERWGVEVEHVRSKYSFQEYFYLPAQKGKFCGNIHGFPMTQKQRAWCNKRIKIEVLQKQQKSGVWYLGIAADEPSRFGDLCETRKSPLVAVGWTELDCLRWCEENNLLSPIYTTSARGGCWFCHNQGIHQLRLLRQNYPDLWELMLQWDADSPVTFKADGHTVHDFDARFGMEDAGLILPADRWKWKNLEEYQIPAEYYVRIGGVDKL